jgi:putative dehydrogenase
MTTMGMVGLGLLGHALASRLRAGGHAVIGFDVAPERRDALATLGGIAAVDARQVGRQSEAVCTVLPSLAAVADVVEALDDAPAIIQMSTISPGLTEHLARVAAGRGQTFLDCPVSGTAGMVARGDGIIFVGSERAAYDRWRPVLEAMLPRAVHVGRAGQAMTLKLVANLLVGVHSAAAAEALAMARRAGLDMKIAFDVLASGAGASRMLEVRGPMMLGDVFPPQMKLDLFMKDLHLIQGAAQEVGASTPLTDVAERLYAAVQGAGHGGEDLAVVMKALEKRAWAGLLAAHGRRAGPECCRRRHVRFGAHAKARLQITPHQVVELPGLRGQRLAGVLEFQDRPRHGDLRVENVGWRGLALVRHVRHEALHAQRCLQLILARGQGLMGRDHTGIRALHGLRDELQALRILDQAVGLQGEGDGVVQGHQLSGLVRGVAL